MKPSEEVRDSAEQELKRFEEALRASMPAGLGAPLTRAESALLRTFIRWRDQRLAAQSETGLSSIQEGPGTKPF